MPADRRRANQPYNRPTTTAAERAAARKRHKAADAAAELAAAEAARDEKLITIAHEHLGIHLPDQRGACVPSYWAIQAALEAAYAAGKAAK